MVPVKRALYHPGASVGSCGDILRQDGTLTFWLDPDLRQAPASLSNVEPPANLPRSGMGHLEKNAGTTGHGQDHDNQNDNHPATISTRFNPQPLTPKKCKKRIVIPVENRPNGKLPTRLLWRCRQAGSVSFPLKRQTEADRKRRYLDVGSHPLSKAPGSSRIPNPHPKGSKQPMQHKRFGRTNDKVKATQIMRLSGTSA